MGLFVNALELHTPEFIKKWALTLLFHHTAAAFQVELPPVAGLGWHECLARYAGFARALAEQYLRTGGDVQALEERLYRSAVKMGRLPYRWLRPASVQDVISIGRVLYRFLAIDLRGDAQGNFVISRCYFSGYYTAEVCRLMSAMDRGLFAGLSNGGQLTFSSRITEGGPCCRAHFTREHSK